MQGPKLAATLSAIAIAGLASILTPQWLAAQPNGNPATNPTIEEDECPCCDEYGDAYGMGQGHYGMHHGGRYGRQAGGRYGGGLYNPQTVETVTGEVVSLTPTLPSSPPQAGQPGIGPGSRAPRFQGRLGGYGVHVQLKTPKETLLVHLGPAPYLASQNLTLQAKDQLEIKGSRVTMMNGQTVLIASQVKKGDRVVHLRDENGIPLWRPTALGPNHPR